MASISDITSGITALSSLLVVSPQQTVGYQPQQKGTSPLLFHYEGEQTAQLESGITDHFVEDNTSLQDQISLMPEMVTTQGFIGELNDVVPQKLQSAAALIQQKLIALSAYTPQLTIDALIAYNNAFLAYQVASSLVSSASDLLATVNGSGNGQSVIGSTGLTTAKNQNQQQIYFQRFYQYWRTRTLFTVQTPWAVFENMAIKSLRAIQDPETNQITDFEVQFKMMRFAQTHYSIVTTYDPNDFQGRAFNQGAPPVDGGAQTPSASSLSFSGALSSMVA